MSKNRKEHILEHELSAGRFSTWLHRIRLAQYKNDGIDVPCGDCNACCRSFQFIHVGPEETESLANIPKELLFAAPGLPRGHVLMGYDKEGRCPMLIDNECSIYEFRPLTCRTYDCRIFPATGIKLDDKSKALITRRADRWKFDFPSHRDIEAYAAVQAAATFIREHAGCFPEGKIPSSATQLAVLAIKVYAVFLEYKDESGIIDTENSKSKIAKAVVEANERFKAG